MAAVVALGGGLVAILVAGDDDGDDDDARVATTVPPATEPDVTLPDLSVPDPTSPESVPAASEEPAGLGDDPELDELAEACFDGALIACDELYAISEIDSDYESYGDTCEGRQDVGSQRFCSAMAGFPVPTQAPDTLPTDDGELLLLSARCWAGNMGACDVMALRAPSGSDYADFGASCAGRQAAEADEPCVESFPEWEDLHGPS